MAEDRTRGSGFSLRRWSERKHASRAVEPAEAPRATSAVHDAQVAPSSEATPSEHVATTVPMPAPTPANPSTPSPAIEHTPVANPTAAPATATDATGPAAASLKIPLPSIESLTPQSDFTPFMQADVAPGLRSAALRKLFADPHFNVMDGLDVYIDDYSKPDPIAPEIVRKLAHARYIFSPPPTRVTAEGHVEDIPEEELRAMADAAAAAETAPPSGNVGDMLTGPDEQTADVNTLPSVAPAEIGAVLPPTPVAPEQVPLALDATKDKG